MNRIACGILYALVISLLLSGCSAEKGLPVGVEKIGATPPDNERGGVVLDASGFLNGTFQPVGTGRLAQFSFPVNYIGSWTLIPTVTGADWFYMMTDSPSSSVTVTATASRIVFDFWDYEMYSNPGTVKFSLDGKSLGTFPLARKDSSGNKILDFTVTTGKSTVATVTMNLISGRVVILGYLLVYE